MRPSLAPAHGFPSDKIYLHNPGTMGGSSGACLPNFLVVKSIHTIRGSWDRSWHLHMDFLVAEAMDSPGTMRAGHSTSTHKSDKGSQCLPLEPKMAVSDSHLPLEPLIVIALLPGSMNREKSTYSGPACLFVSLFFFFF